MADKGAVLRDDEVRVIRGMRGRLARDVGALYGRNAETIRKIWRRETYVHVAEVRSVTEMEMHESAMRMLAVQREVEAVAKRVGEIETGESAGIPPCENVAMPADEAIAAKAKELLGL